MWDTEQTTGLKMMQPKVPAEIRATARRRCALQASISRLRHTLFVITGTRGSIEEQLIDSGTNEADAEEC